MKIRAAVIVSIISLSLVSGDWASFHGDERNTGNGGSSYAPYEDIWWNAPSISKSSIESSAVVGNGVVVIGDWGGNVQVHDIESGALRWSAKMKGAIIGTPAISAERLFVADSTGSLQSFDITTGKVLHTGAVGATKGSITIHEGKLFIGNEGGQVKAYSTQDLTLLWTSAVSSVGGVKDAKTGKCSGGTSVTAGQIRGAPAVYDGRVYVATMTNFVLAFNEEGNPSKQSELQWAFISQDVNWGTPLIDTVRKQLIVGSYDEKVYAFDLGIAKADCGTLHTPKWSYQVPADFGSSKVHSSPALEGDTVVFGANNGRVYGISAIDGKKKWDFITNGEVFSSPAIANGTVVVGSDDKNVYWLHASNGTLIKKYQTGGAIKSSPAIDQNRVFIASFDGMLYNFGPKIPARPDLMISSILLDGNEIAITVQNRGNAESSATDLKVSVDNVLLADLIVPSLKAGESKIIKQLAGTLSGPISVKAQVDPESKVTESNESNNERTSMLTPPPKEDKGIPGFGLLGLMAALCAALLLRRR